MDRIKNMNGKPVLQAVVQAIQANKVYLSEIDGLIGDGDHGMNMNKGFTMFWERIKDKDTSFTDGLSELGQILLTEIGGSMGPIYGTLLIEMADAIPDVDMIELKDFTAMLERGYEELTTIIDAQPGDKTLVDTLAPAVNALKNADNEQLNFTAALENMKLAAGAGKESTKSLMARYGRSSRLGERSIGVLDAGATSCCIILTAMADAMITLLVKESVVN